MSIVTRGLGIGVSSTFIMSGMGLSGTTLLFTMSGGVEVGGSNSYTLPAESGGGSSDIPFVPWPIRAPEYRITMRGGLRVTSQSSFTYVKAPRPKRQPFVIMVGGATVGGGNKIIYCDRNDVLRRHRRQIAAITAALRAA